MTDLNRLLFSVQRYIDTSKAQNKFLKILGQARLRWIVIVIVGFSLILPFSLILDSHENAETPRYDSPFQFTVQLTSRLVIDRVQAGFILSHYFFNDFILLVVNLIVDIKLVRAIKADLKQKLKFAVDQEEQGVGHDRKQKLLAKNKSVEKKANYMILANVLIYSFCRLPELGARLYFVLNYESSPNTIDFINCSYEIFCYLLNNTIQYLYMLAYSFNIFIYYNFISNFRKGFRQFLGLKVKLKSWRQALFDQTVYLRD